MAYNFNNFDLGVIGKLQPYNPINTGGYKESYWEKKSREEQEAKAKKAQRAADEAKYNPGSVQDVAYNNSLQKQAMGVLNYTQEAYKNGKIGTEEYEIGVGNLKNNTALIKGKGEAATAAYKDAYQQTDQLPKYVDKAALNRDIYDLSHPTNIDVTALDRYNKKYDQLTPAQQASINNELAASGKDPNEIVWDRIDPEAIAKKPTDYYSAINTADMYADKTKIFGEKLHKKEVMFPSYDPTDGTALGQMIRSDSTKAKFFKPIKNKNGKVVEWVPGVTNEAADFMLQNDHEINGDADHKLHEYIIREAGARAAAMSAAGIPVDSKSVYRDVERSIDASAWKRDYVKKHLEQYNEVSTESTLGNSYKYGDGKKTDDVTLEISTDQSRNVGTKDQGVASGYSPVEMTLHGEKIKEGLPVNASTVISEQSGVKKTKEELVGDKQFFPTRFIYQPREVKLDKKGNKIWLVNTQDQLKNKDKSTYTYEWVAAGDMVKRGKGRDGKEEETREPVFIPLNELPEIKSKWKIDPYTNRDPKTITDPEWVEMINQEHPGATPQEKLQILKNIKTQNGR